LPDNYYYKGYPYKNTISNIIFLFYIYRLHFTLSLIGVRRKATPG